MEMPFPSRERKSLYNIFYKVWSRLHYICTFVCSVRCIQILHKNAISILEYRKYSISIDLSEKIVSVLIANGDLKAMANGKCRQGILKY